MITLTWEEQERVRHAAAMLMNEITVIAWKYGKNANERRILRDEFLIDMVASLCTHVVKSHNPTAHPRANR